MGGAQVGGPGAHCRTREPVCPAGAPAGRPWARVEPELHNRRKGTSGFGLHQVTCLAILHLSTDRKKQLTPREMAPKR